MLDQIKGLHPGKTIAVLCSSPTVRMFEGQEAVSIACNGAAFLDVPYDYFTCIDEISPRRSWFLESEKHGATRIIFGNLCWDDPILYPDPDVRQKMKNERSKYMEGYRYYPPYPPQAPHLWYSVSHEGLSFYRQGLYDALIPAMQNRIVASTGVAGTALQIAWHMGASEIHLYGCSMDNDSGTHYFYKSGSEVGGTPEILIKSVYILCKAIQMQGVSVIIHGPSKIKELQAELS